jgi:hypothetical protein
MNPDNKSTIKRVELEGVIEEFIYNKLDKKIYQIFELEAKTLLVWNRLDLAFRLFYLESQFRDVDMALSVYRECIRVQTANEFTEFGNDKVGFERFVSDFNLTFSDINENEFNPQKSIIPLATDGSILNGAHRVSSSIFLDKKVSCVSTMEMAMKADWRYFFENGVLNDTLDLVVKSFLKYSEDNTYLAFLWPSGKVNKKKSESCFSNVVYKKEIKLNSNGAFNLLIELYKHMDWVGTVDGGFSGIKQKLIECFPTFDSFTVLVFQQPSLNDVQAIKRKVRGINGIGYSSIHITDTKEEAVRVAELIFNENGLHFLNWSSFFKYIELYDELDSFKKHIKNNAIVLDDVVVDGSTVLALYGLRKNDDIDYLAFSDNEIVNEGYKIDSHDSELTYHEVAKSGLVYNPMYYFIYQGIKFISFQQIYRMKQNRGTPKDIVDCVSMNAILDKDNVKWRLLRVKQLMFYWKIKICRKAWYIIIIVLERTNLYLPVRQIYRWLKKPLS